jgi:hypothetical protein
MLSGLRNWCQDDSHGTSINRNSSACGVGMRGSRRMMCEWRMYRVGWVGKRGLAIPREYPSGGPVVWPGGGLRVAGVRVVCRQSSNHVLLIRSPPSPLHCKLQSVTRNRIAQDRTGDRSSCCPHFAENFLASAAVQPYCQRGPVKG